MGAATRQVRVLVLEDSATLRRDLSGWLQAAGGIEVVGAELDVLAARERMLSLNPDVVLLDLEQRKIEGLAFLRSNLQKRRFPVIALGREVTTGSEVSIDALEAGAFDVSTKTEPGVSPAKISRELQFKIREAARFAPTSSMPVAEETPGHSKSGTSCAKPIVSRYDARQVLLIGASTGGTEAIRDVLKALPADVPGIAIVQHIPPKFSRTFAERLNACCPFEVREAVDGDELHPGLALVAPGDHHMLLEQQGRQYRVRLHQGAPLHHQRPAVDALFDSAAECAGENAVAVVLTGMGRDGAAGLKRLRDRGARTLAQDQASCVVFGMPQAAQQLGAAEEMVSLSAMPQAILRCLKQARHASRLAVAQVS